MERKYCPECKTEQDTTCCACGCGHCVICNYKWCCLPIDSNQGKWWILFFKENKMSFDEKRHELLSKVE